MHCPSNMIPGFIYMMVYGISISVFQDYGSATSVSPLLKKTEPINKAEEKAIPFYRAVMIPVRTFFCLYFQAKTCNSFVGCLMLSMLG